MKYSLSFSLFAVLCIALVVSGCVQKRDTPVDRSSPSFVDKETIPTLDTNSPSNMPRDSAPAVLNASSPGFQTPPEPNYVQNATISLEEKKGFVGRDAVKVWVWNDRGSTLVLLPEGGSAANENMGIVLEANAIGAQDDGRVYFILNGKPLPIMHRREQVRVGSTYIFVSDIFLNELGE